METTHHHSQERPRGMFDTASDGIVLLEKREGHIALVNPVIKEMLGYSDRECLGKKLPDIGVSLGSVDFSTTMRALGRNGILNYEDVLVKNKAGQDIYTDIYMVDRAQLAQCNIRDVTPRKRAEEHLKKERMFITNALDSLPDIFLVFDLEGRFLRWNKTLNSVTGYLDTEIALMRPTDFFRDDDIGVISEAIHTAISKGSVKVDALLITKEGRQLPYSFSASLLLDARGKPMGISGVARDISERKQAEQDLRTAFVKAHEGESRWAAIMSSMGEGISIQNPDYVITYQNQALQELLGDHVGRHCYKAYEHNDQVCPGCPVQMAYEDGGIHKVVRTVTIDKEVKYREVTASPLRDLQGNIVSVIEVIRDVTEQRGLETQLRHAHKMEAVGTLAGGVAHDFNNILNVIMGYSILVIDTLATDSPAREEMHEVLVAAERAADLTKRLLAFSRKKTPEMKPVNLNALLQDLQKMLTRIIRENIDFRLDLTDSPLLVLADGGQIEQVLINLAANAKDAMPEGGRLRISTGLAEVAEADVAAYGYGQPGRCALITVADTGLGMDADTQKKIFDPFFTTKGLGEGTGLGLAISYGIIKQHNGFIKVYSEPGGGTVFKIYLPLSTAAAPDKIPLGIESVKGGSEVILVAEDDAPLRKLSRIELEALGYTVITAQDGEEAFAKFLENREQLDLVVLDMIMPKQNGKKVKEAILQISPRMKILFTSGYTLEIAASMESAEEEFNFIQKPYQPRDLLRKVREVLDT